MSDGFKVWHGAVTSTKISGRGSSTLVDELTSLRRKLAVAGRKDSRLLE